MDDRDGVDNMDNVDDMDKVENMDNIRKFIAANYSDEKLAALLAHAESGRLGWNSCCCVVGIATATHALQTATTFGEMRVSCPGDSHLEDARRLPYAAEAENEFLHIAWSDAGRRERLMPLIREEMECRDRRNRPGSPSSPGSELELLAASY